MPERLSSSPSRTPPSRPGRPWSIVAALAALALALLAPVPSAATDSGHAAVTPANANSPGICGRTGKVHNAIRAAIPGNPPCASVTPAELAAITSLTIQSLYVFGDTLRVGDFDGLTGLRTFNLTNNNALGDNFRTPLQKGLFRDLSALKTLDMSHSYSLGLTTVLPAGFFSGLSELTTLKVRWSALGQVGVSTGLFDGLPALTELDLSHNASLGILQDRQFSSLNNVTKLDLSSNLSLQTIHTDAFTGLDSLTELNLSNNIHLGTPGMHPGSFDHVLDTLTTLTMADRFSAEAFFAPGDSEISLARGGSAATYNVVLQRATPLNLRIPVILDSSITGVTVTGSVRVSGGDLASTGSIIIPAGQTSATASFTAAADATGTGSFTLGTPEPGTISGATFTPIRRSNPDAPVAADILDQFIRIASDGSQTRSLAVGAPISTITGADAFNAAVAEGGNVLVTLAGANLPTSGTNNISFTVLPSTDSADDDVDPSDLGGSGSLPYIGTASPNPGGSATSISFNIPVGNDMTVENIEHGIIVITAVAGYPVASRISDEFSIAADAADILTVSLNAPVDAPAAGFSEAVGDIIYSVTAEGESERPITIPFDISPAGRSDIAVIPSDTVRLAPIGNASNVGSLTLAAGPSPSAELIIRVTDDNADESGETDAFRITITDGAVDAAVAGDAIDHSETFDIADNADSRLLTIIDNDKAATRVVAVRVADATVPASGATPASIAEGGTVRFRIDLDGSATLGDLTLDYEITGDGVAADDFAGDALTGTVLFREVAANQSGASSMMFDLRTADNADNDSDKTFSIEFILKPGGPNSLYGAIPNSPVGARAAVTITDNDTPPVRAAVTVSPARIFEIGNATMANIAVTLNNPAVTGAPLNLPYAITGSVGFDDYTVRQDGGNPPGEPGRGMISFNPGESKKIVTITATPDDDEEGTDTLVFTLLAGNHDTVAITDDDPAARAAITIGDTQVDAQGLMQDAKTAATAVGAIQIELLSSLIRQRVTAASLRPSPASAAPPSSLNISLADNPQNIDDMINTLGLEKSAAADTAGRYAVWVRAQRGSVSGDPTVGGATLSYDAKSTGLAVGAEWSDRRHLAGLAVNHISTNLNLSSSGANATLSKYKESITFIAPYFSFKPDPGPGPGWWASVGVGVGDADATLGDEVKSADVVVNFLNGGAEFSFTRGNHDLVAGFSGLIVKKRVDAFSFQDTIIPSTTIDTVQGRGDLTLHRPFALAGETITPFIGVATIHDFGDVIAGDDHGLAFRTGAVFHKGRFDLDIEFSREVLRQNRSQWGLSGGARYHAGPDETGLSFALRGLRQNPADAGLPDDPADPAWEAGLEGAYGIRASFLHPDGLFTPFATVKQQSGRGDLSSGFRLSVGNGISLGLESSRDIRRDSQNAFEHTANMKGRWVF